MPVVRAVLLLPAVVAGAAAGLLGSFVHALTPVGLPLGMVVALALSVAVFVTCGLALGRRGAVVSAGGWVVVVLLLSTQRPEGDLVVAGSAAGYVWLLGGTVLAGCCIVPAYGRRRSIPGGAPSGAPSAGPEPGR